MKHPDRQQWLPDWSVYDLVLWSIPTLLIGDTGALCIIGVPRIVALAVSSTAAGGIVAYGLFGIPPSRTQEDSN